MLFVTESVILIFNVESKECCKTLSPHLSFYNKCDLIFIISISQKGNIQQHTLQVCLLDLSLSFNNAQNALISNIFTLKACQLNTFLKNLVIESYV